MSHEAGRSPDGLHASRRGIRLDKQPTPYHPTINGTGWVYYEALSIKGSYGYVVVRLGAAGSEANDLPFLGVALSYFAFV